MRKYQCTKCSGTKFFTKKSGNAIGLYCKECGKWIKWLNKKELMLFEQEQLKNQQSEKKYTREEVAEAIELLKGYDNHNLFFHEAVDRILNMFKNME